MQNGSVYGTGTARQYTVHFPTMVALAVGTTGSFLVRILRITVLCNGINENLARLCSVLKLILAPDAKSSYCHFRVCE